MPTIEELIAIGVKQMSNPIYIALIAMIFMQYVGKGILSAIGEAIWRKVGQPANLAVHSLTLLLTVGIAIVFADTSVPLREAVLRGIIALPMAIGEYELMKKAFRAIGIRGWKVKGS